MQMTAQPEEYPSGAAATGDRHQPNQEKAYGSLYDHWAGTCCRCANTSKSRH
jgi:hypothetical protein